MFDMLNRSWWLLALRGVAAIIFGVVAWAWPDIALASLIIVFAAYVLVDGAFAIASVVQARDRPSNWPWLLLQGGLSIVVGIGAVIWPDLTALGLLYFIAAWAIVTGVMQVIAAFELRREITGELWLGLGGLVSIIFGCIAFMFPGAGALAVVWMIGVYAVVFGITALVLAYRLRTMRDSGTTSGANPLRAGEHHQV